MQKPGSYTEDPNFIIYTGPMFGGKTLRMLDYVDRCFYQKRTVLLFKPNMDTRYATHKIVAHANRPSVEAIAVITGDDIIKYVAENNPDVNVVAVDEAFMIEGAADALLQLFRQGKTIVVSSLQLSASGNVFNEMKEMMPWATHIEICPAACAVSGKDAYYTHRKVSGLDEIAVGGADLYEPRCWQNHSYMNLRD